MKKAFSVFFLTALAILTGCNNSDPDIIDISGYESIDLSYKLKTDLPCINAEEAYNVEKYELDWYEYNHGAPVAYDGECFYYIDYLAFDDDPMILSFNPATKEEKGIIYYSELEEGQQWLSINFTALYNSHFFFFVTVQPNEEYYFYDIDLAGGNTYCVKTDKLPGYTRALAAYENCIYFGDSYTNDDSGEKTYIITEYNTDSKSFSTYKANAKIPAVYKNGILYYHDGGLYYDGNEDVPGSGVIFNGDNMILSVDEYFMKHFPFKDKIFYRYYSYDNTDYRIFGYYDEKLIRHDLAVSTVISNQCEFSSDFVFAENADLMSFYLFGDFDEKPVIYDMKNNIFAAIEAENSHDHFYAFSDDNSIVLYLRGHYLEYDNYENDEYVNAQYYKISRKSTENS
ncbi:MAG: hypothetical protein NC203_09155 [Firmicutes bacterium]|nr:hypothetical protein [[Eubacterium] siraeum]MCM1488520.1 hypothetical protein [Bacillota bacterium]